MAENIEQTPDPQEGAPQPALPLLTLEDWQLEAAKLEHRRDAIRRLLEAGGVEPMNDPAYRQLLGRLSLIHDQVGAHALEDMESQFSQDIDKT